jgi:hypothetical protein
VVREKEGVEISLELPDNLTQEQLQQRIHNTFVMVEAAVEAEINGGKTTPEAPVQQIAPVQATGQEVPQVVHPHLSGDLLQVSACSALIAGFKIL